jgi:hypothetical protein
MNTWCQTYRPPHTDTYLGSMARYRVTRIDAEPCPVGHSRRHITDVELTGLDGPHHATMPVIRLMLSADDNVVALSTAAGVEADVRKGRCVCGFKMIRTVHGSRSDDDIDTLPR